MEVMVKRLLGLQMVAMSIGERARAHFERGAPRPDDDELIDAQCDSADASRLQRRLRGVEPEHTPDDGVAAGAWFHFAMGAAATSPLTPEHLRRFKFEQTPAPVIAALVHRCLCAVAQPDASPEELAAAYVLGDEAQRVASMCLSMEDLQAMLHFGEAS